MNTRVLGLSVAALAVVIAVAFYYQQGAEQQPLPSGMPAVAVLRCEPEREGKPLATNGVYDGPSREHANLAPMQDGEISTWDVRSGAVSPEGYYLVCAYGEDTDEYGLTPDTIDMSLAGYGSCRADAASSGLALIGCSE